MSLRVQERPLPNEGRFAAVLPRPGRELRIMVEKACAQIGGGDHWRWRYEGRMVPRLVLLPDPDGGGLAVNPACQGDRGASLRPRVRRAFLAPDDGQFREELSRNDYAQFRRLASAIWHDLGGWPRQPQTFDGPSLERVLGVSDERTIRLHLKDGRRLWADLAAWPWALWPWGRPPVHWHRSGPDATEAATFYSWQEGALVLPSEIDGRP